MNKKLTVLTILLFACYVTNAQQWRLMAKVYDWGNKNTPQNHKDSTHFYYNVPSGRGSDHFYKEGETRSGNAYGDNISCDYSVSFGVLTTISNGVYHYDITSSLNCEREYDSANRLMESTYYSGSFIRDREIYTYDSSSRLKRLLSNTFSTLYYYDTLGRLSKVTSENIQNGSISTGFFEYDSAGLLVKDTTYNPAHNYATSNYYYYDNAGKKIKRINNKYNTPGTTPYSSTPTDYAYYPDGKLKRSYPAGGPYVDYDYNSLGYIERVTVIATTTYYIRYYYEHYWPASVASAVKNEAELKVYPVPANTLLNVEAEFKEGGKLQGSVTDMQGSVVYQWKDGATTNYKKQVQLGHLPAGIYMLQLYTDNEVATKQFIKQ